MNKIKNSHEPHQIFEIKRCQIAQDKKYELLKSKDLMKKLTSVT